tara:strand:- start:153 stop:353 length:201 start_codon:yes stop_codon:yes gene_type:complete
MRIGIGDRVELHNHSFLSDGHILQILGVDMFIVKLDKKAPNEYAWETDEVVMFAHDLKVAQDRSSK